jgi:hypothetical protein
MIAKNLNEAINTNAMIADLKIPPILAKVKKS